MPAQPFFSMSHERQLRCDYCINPSPTDATDQPIGGAGGIKVPPKILSIGGAFKASGPRRTFWHTCELLTRTSLKRLAQ